VHPDDLKNPDYRKGRHKPVPLAIPDLTLTEEARRARFAMRTARAEFGRFYWNEKLTERMKLELASSRRRKREEKETEARRRKRSGANP